MFGKHVKKHLSAYAHGELSAEESGRVAEHLRGCHSCRKDFEEIKLGIRLAESLPSVSAPASLWDGIESLIVKDELKSKHPEAASPKTFQRPLLFIRWRPVAAACLICLFLAAAWFYVRATRPAWEVARIEGEPRIDAGRIGERGRLAVGEWLETDAGSRAQIEVANIGHVEVDPNTRVRLVETRLTEHRLELARGRLHARIWAPPRLFFVNTPSAVAADLGCAYTLEVDDAGRSLLHVTSGWVALEAEGRESIVPAGAACLTKPGAGPGTPFFEDATEEFVEALARFDFEGGGGKALDAVLASARRNDTLTLWHLLARAEEADRSRVYERLAMLTPPPAGVTREGVLALDRAMLDAWKDQLEGTWLKESFPAARRAWRKIWR